VLRPNFSGRSSERFRAYGLSLVDALPLVFGQPGYNKFGIYCLSLESIRSTLRDVLRQGGSTMGVPSKHRRSP
jgi:hypothetical protein